VSRRLPPGKVPWEVVGAHLPTTDPSVRLGPGVGEDAALVDIEGGTWALASDPISFTAVDAGRLAVLVNANDVAVRGARPTFFTAVIMVAPEEATEERVVAILEQIQTTCAEIGAQLVGGHTEVTPGLSHSVVVGTMLGRIDGRAVTTGGVEPGHRIGLTRAAGLEGTGIILAEIQTAAARELAGRLPGEGPAWRLSVVDEALALAAIPGVSALHDVTEGGVGEAVSEMERAAGVVITAERDSVPVHQVTRDLCERLGLDPLGLIGSGAMLLACGAAAEDMVAGALDDLGVPLTWIGRAAAEGTPSRSRLPRFPRDEIIRLERFTRLRGVIFDMDGTLVDSVYDWPSIRIELGMPDGDFINGINGTEEPERTLLWERLEAIEHEATEAATIMPGALEILEALHGARIPVALVTNNSERNTRECLARFGMTFDVVITRDSGMCKPSGAPFVAAASAMGLNPDEILAVGDSRHDLSAALDAGCGAVCVVGHAHHEGHGPADLSVPGVVDLLPTVELLFSRAGTGS
jgi:hydrogenase expression/formation protein HypE